MNAQSKIREALKTIMDDGEANACRIEKAYLYDGATMRNGWHYTRFNSTPTYLGSSLGEALETIEQIKEERNM